MENNTINTIELIDSNNIKEISQEMTYEQQDNNDLSNYANVWLKDNIGKKFIKPNKAFAQEEWLKIGEDYYYFNKTQYCTIGKMYKNGYMYEFDNNGVLISNNIDTVKDMKKLKIFYRKNNLGIVVYTTNIDETLHDILPLVDKDNIKEYGDGNKFDYIIVDYDIKFEYEPWKYELKDVEGEIKLVRIEN